MDHLFIGSFGIFFQLSLSALVVEEVVVEVEVKVEVKVEEVEVEEV